MVQYIAVFILAEFWLYYVSTSSARCSVNAGTNNNNHHHHQHRVIAPFVDVPPNVFAPRGRLYNVEDAVHTVSNHNNHDTSSTSLIVLKCNDGIVAITTLPQSPYLQHQYYNDVDVDDDDVDDDIENENETLRIRTTGIERNDNNTKTTSVSSVSSSTTMQYKGISLSIRDCITSDQQSMDIECTTTIPPFGRIQWPKRAPLRTRLATTTPAATKATSDAINFEALIKTSIYKTTGQQQQNIVLSITVGNAVESQILRHRIYQSIDRLQHPSTGRYGPISLTTSSLAAVLARTIADQNQQRTQTLSSTSGRMIAASVVLIDYTTWQNHSGTIYQIDPSGQYWICQAVTSGRYASMIEKCLRDRLLERQHRTDTTVSSNTNEPESVLSTRQRVCAILSHLSMDDCLTIATQCMIDGTKSRGTTNDRQQRSRLRLHGVAISTTGDDDGNQLSIQTYKHHGLLSRLRQENINDATQ